MKLHQLQIFWIGFMENFNVREFNLLTQCAIWSSFMVVTRVLTWLLLKYQWVRIFFSPDLSFPLQCLVRFNLSIYKHIECFLVLLISNLLTLWFTTYNPPVCFVVSISIPFELIKRAVNSLKPFFLLLKGQRRMCSRPIIQNQVSSSNVKRRLRA